MKRQVDTLSKRLDRVAPDRTVGRGLKLYDEAEGVAGELEDAKELRTTRSPPKG